MRMFGYAVCSLLRILAMRMFALRFFSSIFLAACGIGYHFALRILALRISTVYSPVPSNQSNPSIFTIHS